MCELAERKVHVLAKKKLNKQSGGPPLVGNSPYTNTQVTYGSVVRAVTRPPTRWHSRPHSAANDLPPFVSVWWASRSFLSHNDHELEEQVVSRFISQTLLFSHFNLTLCSRMPLDDLSAGIGMWEDARNRPPRAPQVALDLNFWRSPSLAPKVGLPSAAKSWFKLKFLAAFKARMGSRTNLKDGDIRRPLAWQATQRKRGKVVSVNDALQFSATHS